MSLQHTLRATGNRFKKGVVDFFRNEPVTVAGGAVPELKEPIKKRVINYVKIVATDYKEVGKDVLKYCKTDSFKALGYALSLGMGVLLIRTNPDHAHYTSSLVEREHDMIMCGPVTRNPRSEYYLHEVNKLVDGELLEHRSYGLFSVMLVKPFGADVQLYENQCGALLAPNKYNVFNWLHNSLRYVSRIVDVGALGNWYFLNKYMRDFDVNEEEFKK